MTHPHYAIAKKLKDAGFPQDVPYDEVLYGPELTMQDVHDLGNGIEVSDAEQYTAIWPSTDALVEQTGVTSVTKYGPDINEDFRWSVYSSITAYGITLKEALINLWFALYNK